jgi:hypothetical protein
MLKAKEVIYMTGKIQSILYLIIVMAGFGACSPSPPVILTATLLPGLSPPPSPEYPMLVTPRVTPFPTRSYADAREELSYMLQTNGNCALPCFWGIQPDQTRYEELYGVIDRLGGSRFETLQANGHLRVASNFRFEERSGIIVEFGTDLQDNVVKDLKVILLNLLDTGITPEDWSAYNMNEILRIYGVPDTAELYFSGPNNSLSFGIRLKYERIQTSIKYYGIIAENDKYQTQSSVIFCPETIGVHIVELHMGEHPFNVGPNGVPLSKATGLDEQSFHKLFTENPSACLTLNRAAFYP